MSLPRVVSQDEWVAARKQLLEREKQLTRQRDEVNTARRELPMVAVEKPYVFRRGGETLRFPDLFEGRHQLVVYHAMWLYDRGICCPSCSAFLDQIGHLAHLGVRDTTFAAISRAPVDQLEAFRARMGWTFPWYSSEGSEFNFDFHVTFDESVAPIEYNFLTAAELEQRGAPFGEWEQPFDLHGLSVFLREGKQVFHTYSAYARGTDNLGFISDFLDLTPLGRQEAWEEPKGRASALGAGAGSPALRYHDEY